MNKQAIKESIVVSAQQMADIEGRIFDQGMPVPALMEKAAGLCFREIINLYPLSKVSTVGVLAGLGHNGGDALVVARELHLAGYQVKVCRPLTKLKELTASHAEYAASLGIPFAEEIDSLQECELIIDGLFGFGLTRPIEGNLAETVNKLNSWCKPVVSIDLPSGINTDTGETLGTAVKATYTLCLGLWKRAFFQDEALEYIGKAIKLDFGIPEADIKAVVGEELIQQLTPSIAKQFLPLPRPPVTHKYKQGTLLLVCGSRRYPGAAILNALGARGSGVGMLSVAVPQSLKDLIISQLPESLVVGCPETESGAIDSIPLSDDELAQFDTIAIGSGLTTEAQPVIKRILNYNCPIVLDADGLNIVAKLASGNPQDVLNASSGIRIVTPHPGEFKRLFPNIGNPENNRIQAAQKAAKESNAIVLLKGGRTVIAHPDGTMWLIPQSTPALARGGSGDVLTGLLSGLVAQQKNLSSDINDMFNTVALAAYWHAQAGIKAAQERTELGVDAYTLSQYLNRVNW